MASTGLWMANFSKTFWNEDFWLPPNVTWDQLQRTDEYWIPNVWDLWISLPLAVLLFSLRLLWERYIATPIGLAYKLRDTPSASPEPIPALESAFRQYNKVIPKDSCILEGLCKQTDLSERQIERWWRRRKVLGKLSPLQRFRETSWRFLFYLVAFWYGIIILSYKEWFYTTWKCWEGYPYQDVTLDIRLYYMIQLGFYGSLIMSIYMDHKRKDFIEMMVHHLTTIMLMLISWTINMVRFGALILVLHDSVDYWLEGAKIAKYLRYHKVCDRLFIIFVIVWFITRICLYPYTILTSAIYSVPQTVGWFDGLPYFISLLVMLQILHIIWFYVIIKMCYEVVIMGSLTKDNRSDTEPETTTEEEEQDVEEESKKKESEDIPKPVSQNGITTRRQANRSEANNNTANGKK